MQKAYFYTLKRHKVIDRNSILADNNGHKVSFHRLNKHTLWEKWSRLLVIWLSKQNKAVCAVLPTSSSGMLMSMCSNTMNSFFTLTGTSHGRCSSAFTQYLTLPCFPSKEVAKALTDRRDEGERWVRGRLSGLTKAEVISYVKELKL